MRVSDRFEASPFAPLIVVGGFVLGGLVVIPVTKKTMMTVPGARPRIVPTPHPTLLMGDLNEWFLWGRPLRWLHAHFQATPSPRSLPARTPLLALDRIWIEPRALLRRLCAHATPAARAASDHIPIVADIILPDPS